MFAVVSIFVVLVIMVIIVMVVVIVVIIMLVMVIMMVIVVFITAGGCQCGNIPYSNCVYISDLLITIKPSSKLQPSAFFDISSVYNIVIHFTYQMR